MRTVLLTLMIVFPVIGLLVSLYFGVTLQRFITTTPEIRSRDELERFKQVVKTQMYAALVQGVILIIPTLLLFYGFLSRTLVMLDIGKAEVLKAGNDAVIFAIGTMVQPALEASKNLAEDEHLSVAVVNARFVKPLDTELILEFARKNAKIVTVEEHVLQGGFGSAVLELLHAQGLHQIMIRCIGLPDQYIEHGSQGILRHKYGLDAEHIQQVILEMVKP